MAPSCSREVRDYHDSSIPLQRVKLSNARYRFDNIVENDLIKMMKNFRARGLGPEAITTEFLKMREGIKPVMRHFFREKHKLPMSWFAMRLNYTRSVAVTSIVGHILGLGDRHTSNILLDTVTGEAVHIDLGISFEQVNS